MNSTLTKNTDISQLSSIRFYAALTSLLLSVLAFQHDDLINSDGILYLNMASAYLQGGLSATAELYDWPFFSMLIAEMHQFTGFGLERSGQIINTLLFVVFTDALVLITSRLLENKIQLIIASVFLLCFFTINHYRSYIIRDIGYWALMTVAVYRMLIFIEKPSWLNGSWWQLSTMLAVLFRVEGIVIVVASPLFMCVHFHIKDGLKATIKLTYLYLFAAIVTVMIFMQQQGIEAAFGKLLSVTYFLDWIELSNEFQNRADIIGQQALSEYSERYAGDILTFGLVLMLMMKVVSGLGVNNLGVYLFAKYCGVKIKPNTSATSYLYFFASLNIIILCAFLFRHYFVSTRYALMLIAVLALLLLPSISYFLEQQWRLRHKRTLAVIGFLLLVSVIDTFTSSVSKGYIKETAIWAGHELPDNSIVLTSNIFIDFYVRDTNPSANIQLDRTFEEDHQKFDYFITIEKANHPERKIAYENWALTPVYKKQNTRGDTAVVYQVMDRGQ
ncbi:MAG TPA: hypothetical protein ENH74_11255 [Methylophaga sp.]|nr:hypothetical protein [Methylophaga sp.]